MPGNLTGKYVIEHYNHGVYVGIDWSNSGNSYGPRFRWSIKRSEGVVFASKEEAYREREHIKNFTDPNWKRPKWIDGCIIHQLIA